VPADRTELRPGREPPARRSVVPPAAGRSLWLAAAYTGAATALLGAVAGIAGVAVCWLPASGPAGNAGSAIRAGILTFLAALHGGITVDGVGAGFVPLGLTALVGLLAWRAGTGLADAAAGLETDDPRLLRRAGALQLATFAVSCAIAARLGQLGTSSVSAAAAFLAGLLLFAATGTVAFVRAAGLGAELGERLPSWAARAARAAVAGGVVYLAAGALLVAASLFLHRGRVELLSQQLGGGWSGAPVLLLGVLAAPNAAIAGASYLAGPGFAVGSGTTVSLGSSAHGTLPAFPVLGALPAGPAGPAAWLLAAATPIAAGLAVVRIARTADSERARWRDAGFAVLGAGLLALGAAWLGGGGIGSGHLAEVGASPWRFGAAVAAGVAVTTAPSLAGLAAVGWWRGRAARPAAPRLTAVAGDADEADVTPDRPADGDRLAAG
jgi:hypothetical protein